MCDFSKLSVDIQPNVTVMDAVSYCWCEAAEWSATSEGCFLRLAEGSRYMDVFQRLRLNYIVSEYNSALLVENDHILPRGACPFIVYLNKLACATDRRSEIILVICPVQSYEICSFSIFQCVIC